MPDRPAGTARPLWQSLRTAPRIADRTRARERLEALDGSLGSSATSARLAEPRVRAVLAGIADHSPYLWHLIASDPERLRGLLEENPQRSLDALIAGLHGVPRQPEVEVMQRLRLAKQQLALLVALADLGGSWSLEEVMRALSSAADAFIGAALAHLLHEAARGGRLASTDPQRPEIGCGLMVLGLGKLGGCELNYSSDVDLVIVFDPVSPVIVDPDDAKRFFARLVRDLVRILQQPTADGYVLRVDLRLRPDPGSSAAAIGLEAAFTYYESFGQNWERAAMIKARPVAGDLALGEAFIKGLAPFIWRCYFDYAALADIHAMKRQIHATKGHGKVAVAGHDVKLGRGGIREIEFFVQTQQLIFGGKRSGLRGSRTLPMLRALLCDAWIGPQAVADLTRAYEILRRIEHRLQMIGDEQTHRLPATHDGIERFARFCGFASGAAFSALLVRHLNAVAYHYTLLFEQAPALDAADGSLVFTGVADDPETLQTLAALGYRSPVTVAQTLRHWHSGRVFGVRSPRSRETLTDLVPKLLVAFANSADPDAAVAAFDKALERMPAAGELFAILAANPSLRALFGDILGSAPPLAAAVILRPHLLDGAIDPSHEICLDDAAMTERARAVVQHAKGIEQFLDAIRDFQHEEHFLIGVALLSGGLDMHRAGEAYSALAVAIIRQVMVRLREAFAAEHGQVPHSGFVVVAMGKLGSREMTATSDLDLVFLYTYDETHPMSDGAPRLEAQRYFARLANRLVSYLTAATRRGRLYEVDMRLRPSGRQGPLASKLSAFSQYQRDEAATWERMALTRARVVAGDQTLMASAAREIAAALRTAPPTDIRRDITGMRALIAKEKPPSGKWDLKLLPGGLVDIEFIAQALVLLHAATTPALLEPATSAVLDRAVTAGLLDPGVGRVLREAHRLFSGAMQMMRLTLDGAVDPETTGDAVQRRIATALGLPDLRTLAAEIDSVRQAVREIFAALLSDR